MAPSITTKTKPRRSLFFGYVALLIFALLAGNSTATAPTDKAEKFSDAPKQGIPLDPIEAMAGSLTVFPDGRGLPEGKGDSTLGRVLYQQHCLACHGKNGTGGMNEALVGGTGSLTTTMPIKTVGSFWPYATTLFDYIQRAMPYNAPGSLTADELYSVTAYLLVLNKIVDSKTTLDQRSLPEVVMPNQQGFDWQ